jgi:hypothetical protein
VHERRSIFNNMGAGYMQGIHNAILLDRCARQRLVYRVQHPAYMLGVS